MELSIIILNYKTKGLVKQCIKNAMKSADGLEYEIIVVDNGSFDGCEEMIRETYPGVRCIQTGKNLGFGAGNNRGIAEARGEYILILTPDVTALGDSIKNMLRVMNSCPDIGIAGPKLMNPDRTTQDSCRTFQTPRLILLRRTPLGLFKSSREELERHLLKDMDRNDVSDVDWVTGACMMVNKKALEKVGGFDERFFFYVEDMEWCRRFWMNGFRVAYIPEAEMVHLWERASNNDMWAFMKLNKWARWHISSWIKYFKKYFGQPHNVRDRYYERQN